MASSHRFLVRALLSLIALIPLALSVPAYAQATSPNAEVQTSWRLLDYIAVDYREAVRDGKVVNAAEYQEMAEFSASVSQRLAALPDKPARQALLTDAQALQKAIGTKAAPADIAVRARKLATELLAAYPVPLAPTGIPDPARGRALYAENCASCHGGKGEGASGTFAQLDPPPIAFADRERARDRSVFGLYQVISQGLEGTAMQSYAALPEEDRWALAFHAGSLAYGDAREGERIWHDDEAVRRLIPDMAALVAVTPAELERQIGQEKAAAVIAYLRANPGALATAEPATLQLARDRLRESMQAYSAGDRKRAEDLALSAYLDGFEPVEAVLATRDGDLMRQVEQAMSNFRIAITRNQPLDRVRLLDHDGGELMTDNIIVYRRERHPPDCGDRGGISNHGRANNERRAGLSHQRLAPRVQLRLCGRPLPRRSLAGHIDGHASHPPRQKLGKSSASR